MHFFDELREYGDDEVANGNFVTLEREVSCCEISEKLMTFSGIIIKRIRPKHAHNATTIYEIGEDFFEDYEETYD